MNPRTSGILFTVLAHTLVALLLISPGSSAGGCGQGEARADFDLSKMDVIEAQIAYTTAKRPQRQPQKPPPRPTKKAGPIPVSRDDKAKPKPAPEEDFSQAWRKFKITDEQLEDEEERPQPADDRTPAAFDGSKRGWAEVNKGDPYLRELAEQMRNCFKVPSLETGSGQAVGCVRLHPDGTIVSTKIWAKSGNTNIDRAAEEALRCTLDQRQKNPSPVPDNLISRTTEMTCFKFGL